MIDAPTDCGGSEHAAPTLGQWAQWACVLEVTAPKAGNVHPDAPFNDVTWKQFITSADVVRPILDQTAARGVGATVLDCVRATRAAVGVNTNLGMVLLLAPLCAVPWRGEDESVDTLKAGIGRVLATLTARDAEAVYDAIRLANPAGLGSVARQDVHAPPTAPLVEAMRLASSRDLIARQYVNGFADVFAISQWFDSPGASTLDRQIVAAHLRQMANEPDSLIARKCGAAVALESQQRARAVPAAGWPDSEEGRRAFAELDRWLRADAHRRNPGTSADLIAAGLFAALRLGRIRPTFDWSSSLVTPPCAS